jgi:adenosylhomocysteine nucleosidase
MRFGIVVGMKSEAALLPPGLSALCAGGLPHRAEALARVLADGGAEALVSLGIAGGLDPVLKPGAVVIGDGVRGPGWSEACDASWVERLRSLLPRCSSGWIWAAETAASTVSDKQRLYQDSGAVAVDLESGAVARVAAERGLPFAIIRTVADPAERGLPVSALVGLDQEGNARPLAVITALARRPGDLGGLIRVGLDSKAALSALRDALKIVGPTLGL